MNGEEEEKQLSTYYLFFQNRTDSNFLIEHKFAPQAIAFCEKSKIYMHLSAKVKERQEPHTSD